MFFLFFFLQFSSFSIFALSHALTHPSTVRRIGRNQIFAHFKSWTNLLQHSAHMCNHGSSNWLFTFHTQKERKDNWRKKQDKKKSQCSWRQDIKAPFKLNQHLISDFGLKRHLSLLKTKERKSDIKIKKIQESRRGKRERLKTLFFYWPNIFFYINGKWKY